MVDRPLYERRAVPATLDAINKEIAGIEDWIAELFDPKMAVWPARRRQIVYYSARLCYLEYHRRELKRRMRGQGVRTTA